MLCVDTNIPKWNFSAVRISLLSTLIFCLVSITSGRAQNFDPVTPYVSPHLNLASAGNLSRATSEAVGRRLAPVPVSQILALAFTATATSTYSDEAYNEISGEKVGANQSLYWNIWTDATSAYTNRRHPTVGYEGWLSTISVGVDRKIGESAVIGIIASGETSQSDTVLGPGTFETNGFGFGIYAGSAWGEHWVADAMLVWQHFDNELSQPFVRDEFDSSRLNASANLTGYWYKEAWRTSPFAGAIWSQEDQDASLINPAQVVTITQLSAGIEFGYSIFQDADRSIEPWTSLTAEWAYHDSGVSVFGPDPDVDEFDLRLAGGINAALNRNFTLTLRADLAGLLRDDFVSASIGGQAALQF